MINYYNENDPKAAAWLRELIKDGHIANGIVDERSIKDVQPNDLTDCTQCHFFAGIGGWPYALRLAGWPDERPVWTGSCPCQPFSAAGKRGGTDDARHLWPEFYRLIGECRPATVFGEQVASKDGLAWLDIVSADLESADYAVGAADLCAAGVGAPHIRQRLYFVADSQCGTSERHRQQVGGPPRVYQGNTQERQRLRDNSRNGEFVGKLAENGTDQRSTWAVAASNRTRLEISGSHEQRAEGKPATVACGVADELADADGRDASAEREQRSGQHGLVTQDGRIGSVEHAKSERRQQRRPESSGRRSERRRSENAEPPAQTPAWGACDFIPCTDGKARPVESGTFPLAHGVPHRVGLLRGYGNAIVPQVAAEFVRATMDSGHGC